MLRILSRQCADGATHMTTDEALLAIGEGPVMRLYTWQEPTISLGYFQDYASLIKTLPPDTTPPCVRRITGGGAIWHFDEITYCLVATLGRDVPATSPAIYHLIHTHIADALRQRGAAIASQQHHRGDRRYRDEPRCFASPATDDLVHPRGGKILGSAIRTRDNRVLIHGSLKTASNAWDQDVSTGCGLNSEDAANALHHGLINALSDYHDGALEICHASELTSAERTKQQELWHTRYATPEWVEKRLGPRP